MTDSSGYGETPTFDSLRQKVREWTTKFSNISYLIPVIESYYKKELEKVLKESAEELNSAISNLEAKYVKPKNPLNENEKLEKVMEELKGSLLPPNKYSYNKRNRSEPDENVIKRIRRQSELIKEIKNLSEWINENNCDTLNKGNKEEEKNDIQESVNRKWYKVQARIRFFFMRLVRFLNKYSRLLRSSQPLYLFKSNMKHLLKICSDYGSEWRVDAREYYALTSTEEENDGMEYDEL